MRKCLKYFYSLYTDLINSIISILSVLLFSSFRINSQINKCKNENKINCECIIMGNGPSLSSFLDENFNKICDKDIFAVNFFCKTSYFEKVKPSFYVLLDPVIFSNSSSSEFENDLNELVLKINSISWKMVLFIPSRFMNSSLVKKFNSDNYLKIIPFNYTPVNGVSCLENYLFQNNLGMPLPETVLNASIFLAIALNFSSIHLYGVEQSWLKYLTVYEDNRISVGLPHFYSGSDSTDECRTLSEFLHSQANAFKSHMRLNEFAKYRGIRIFNHTRGSYIDAYERILD